MTSKEAPEKQLGRMARVGPRMVAEIEKMKSRGWRRIGSSREPRKGVCRPGLLQDSSVCAVKLLGSRISGIPGLEAFTTVCCGGLMHGLTWKMQYQLMPRTKESSLPVPTRELDTCLVIVKGVVIQSLHKSFNLRGCHLFLILAAYCCPLLLNTQECKSLPHTST